jgi:hypothetical protein
MIQKPSDKIAEIKNSLMKDGTWSEQECVTIAIVSYLDLAYEEILSKESNNTPIVDLLKEIERQKFDGENKCARILITRMVSRFNEWCIENVEDARIASLRRWMFVEDNK